MGFSGHLIPSLNKDLALRKSPFKSRFSNVDLCGGTLCMGKAGTIWQFFRALFPSTWRTLSPDALFTRIQDTRKHPESATFSCFPC